MAGETTKVLGIKVNLDAAQAVAAASETAEAVAGIGEAASDLGSRSEGAGEVLSGAFEKLRGTSADVDRAIDAVAASLERMEGKSTAPNTIAKNAALAAVDLQALKAATEAAGVSLEQIGPEAQAGFLAAQKAIDGTVDRARVLNIAILDTKEKAGLGSRTMRELAESMGKVAESSDRVAVATEKSALEAAQASAQFSAFGASMQTLVRQGADVSKEVAAVVKALDGLEKAGDSPRALIRNAGLAEIALEKLKVKIDAASKAGTAIGAGVSTSLRGLEAQIASAVKRSGDLADRFGDLRVKAGFSAEGIRNLAASMGSAQTLFSTMETTLGGLGGRIGLLGLGVQGLVDGFRLTREAGVALGDALGGIAEKAGAQTLALANTAASTAEIGDASRLAERGLIALGGSSERATENLKLYSIAQGRGSEATRKWATDLAGLSVPLRGSFEAVSRQADAMSAVLQREFGKSRDAGLLWVASNKGAIDEVIAKHRLFGEAIPAELRKAVDAYDAHQKAIAQTGKTLDELTKKYADNAKAAESLSAQILAINQKRAAEQVAIAASSTAAALDVDVKLKALNALGLADEEYRAAKKKILAELQTAVEAASAAEAESLKKASAAQTEAQEKYKGTAEALDSVNRQKAGLVGKTEEEVTAGAAVKKYNDEVAAALAGVEAKYGSTKTEAEKFRLAMEGVAVPVVATKAGTEELNVALEAFKNKLNGMDTQVAAMTREMAGFGGSMDEPTAKAWALAAALQAVAAAAAAAQQAAAAAAGSSGGGGSIKPSDPGFVGPPAPVAGGGR